MTYTPYQFANGAQSTVGGGAGGLGTPLNPGDTTLYLPTGQGSRFPSSGYFMLQIGTTEYVKVTLRSTDTLTIVRAQEGTSAGTWAVGTTVQDIVSAQSLNDGMSELATLDSGKASLTGAAFTGDVSTTGNLSATLNGTISGTLGVTGATTLSSTLGVTGAATLTAGIASYKSETTAGEGVPVIVAIANAVNVTATTLQTPISYTTPNDGAKHAYRVSGFLVVNNGVSGNNLTFQWSYVDATGVSRTDSGVPYGTSTALAGGSSIANNRYEIPAGLFSANPNTSITVTYRDPTNTPNDTITIVLERLI